MNTDSKACRVRWRLHFHVLIPTALRLSVCRQSFKAPVAVSACQFSRILVLVVLSMKCARFALLALLLQLVPGVVAGKKKPVKKVEEADWHDWHDWQDNGAWHDWHDWQDAWHGGGGGRDSSDTRSTPTPLEGQERGTTVPHMRPPVVRRYQWMTEAQIKEKWPRRCFETIVEGAQKAWLISDDLRKDDAWYVCVGRDTRYQ